jgi:hypothetical protein
MVPGEGAAQLLRKPEDGGGQGRAQALSGEPVREGEQQPIAAVTLDKVPTALGRLPNTKSPSPWPGTARSAASGVAG